MDMEIGETPYACVCSKAESFLDNIIDCISAATLVSTTTRKGSPYREAGHRDRKDYESELLQETSVTISELVRDEEGVASSKSNGQPILTEIAFFWPSSYSLLHPTKSTLGWPCGAASRFIRRGYSRPPLGKASVSSADEQHQLYPSLIETESGRAVIQTVRQPRKKETRQTSQTQYVLPVHRSYEFEQIQIRLFRSWTGLRINMIHPTL
ncbi:hypothetical protein HD806DRAFT_280197 [Xylariaceae sp. AK1471]|nr:hypothetical protein HD806DRAFT_280197 [Xylariaceae sp. AK1471]